MKIGTTVLNGPLPNDEPTAHFEFLRGMAIEMESAGLDSIWLYDHLLFRWPGRPTDGFWECWTMWLRRRVSRAAARSRRQAK